MPNIGLPQAPKKDSPRFDDWTQSLAKRLGLFRTLLQAHSSHTAGRVAGTYFLGLGEAAGISGTGTLYPPALIYISSSDYKIRNGPEPKLRIRGTLHTNDVAPTGNFTFGLYPVTRPASSGGAGLVIYTLGTVVTGSAPAAISAPSADTSNVVVGEEFTVPADGYYVLGVVTTATVAASSHVHLSAFLQIRNA